MGRAIAVVLLLILGGTHSLAQVSITTIQASDQIKDSRAVINTNFSNLKTAADRYLVGLLSAIPATCTTGALYFATDATAGIQLYECVTTNTWKQKQLSAGPSGAVVIDCSSDPCTIDGVDSVISYLANNESPSGLKTFTNSGGLGIPTASGGAPTASGRFLYDTSTHKMEMGTNGSTKVIATEDGNVATATALAADPSNCSAGQAAGGVNASGTAESCVTAGYDPLDFGTIKKQDPFCHTDNAATTFGELSWKNITGSGTFAAAGSLTAADTNHPCGLQITNNNNQSQISPASSWGPWIDTDTNGAWEIKLAFRVDSATAVGVWFGVTAAPAGNFDTSTSKYVQLRFSTAAGDSTWQCRGATDAGTETGTSMTAAVTANTTQVLRIFSTSAGSVSCAVGAEVVSVPGTLPTQALLPVVLTKSTAAADKIFKIYSFGYQQTVSY